MRHERWGASMKLRRGTDTGARTDTGPTPGAGRETRRGRPSGLALGVGVAIGALVAAPVGVQAAGSLVEISSKSGRVASVSQAAQLQVTEALHSTLWHGIGTVSPNEGCKR